MKDLSQNEILLLRNSLSLFSQPENSISFLSLLMNSSLRDHKRNFDLSLLPSSHPLILSISLSDRLNLFCHTDETVEASQPPNHQTNQLLLLHIVYIRVYSHRRKKCCYSSNKPTFTAVECHTQQKLTHTRRTKLVSPLSFVRRH
jgi:hypothetical protein